MILKMKRYLSAYNEYYEVSVEGAYINMKLRIGNRESGIGNRELVLVPYLSKRLRDSYSNKELGTSSRFPVPDSRFPILSFILIYAPSTQTSQYSLYADK